METERISRIDREPDGRTLAESLLEGSFGRVDELKSFLDLLYRIDGNYSIFLDGEWGIGKTYFIKQAIMCLKLFPYTAYREEYGLNEDEKETLISSVKPESILDGNVQVPAYFNAWEYDYAINPVIPLLDSLIRSFPDQSSARTKSRSIKEILAKLPVEFSVGTGPAGITIGNPIEALRTETLTYPLEQQQEIRTSIEEVLRNCLEGRGQRIVLFIDELDRCRPDYAAQVLEAMKFLFNLDFLTVVFSVNERALGSVISVRYGQGFDQARYLMKFYDRRVTLSSFDVKGYLNALGIDGSDTVIETIAHCVNAHSITMRDINRSLPLLQRLIMKIDLSRSFPRLQNLRLPLLANIVLFYSTSGPATTNALLMGEISDPIFDWWKTDDEFGRAVMLLSNDCFTNDLSKQAPTDANLETILNYRLGELFLNLFPLNQITTRHSDYHVEDEYSKLRKDIATVIGITNNPIS